MLHYSFAISCCSSKTMDNRVTLSFLGSLRFVLPALSGLPNAYMHHPIMPMKMSAGRSMIISALLRLRLPFWDTNFAPDY